MCGSPVTVVVKDAAGRVVGHLEPTPSPEWFAEMKRRAAAPGPRYSSASVLAMMDARQAERDRLGPFDVEYMQTFIERLERDDPARYGPVRAAA